MDKTTVTFSVSDEIPEMLDRIALSLRKAKLRLKSGNRLKRHHVISALIGYLHSLPEKEREDVLLKGMEHAKIPYLMNENPPFVKSEDSTE